ncbi:MAG TPA: hypothetical protein VF062_15830 [Candidatus Limnocylindrales bacterium]
MPEDGDFQAQAEQALAGIDDPWRREVLRGLAAVAADCPRTPPEISYELILRETFRSLATGEPPLTPADVEWLLFPALESLDRGGFTGAADAIHATLAYLSTQPGY